MMSRVELLVWKDIKLGLNKTGFADITDCVSLSGISIIMYSEPVRIGGTASIPCMAVDPPWFFRTCAPPK